MQITIREIFILSDALATAQLRGRAALKLALWRNEIERIASPAREQIIRIRNAHGGTVSQIDGKTAITFPDVESAKQAQAEWAEIEATEIKLPTGPSIEEIELGLDDKITYDTVDLGTILRWCKSDELPQN